MDENTIKIKLFWGLCILSPCFSHVYHVVKERKTWVEAQMYCRDQYTDLVTINSTEDMALVKNILSKETDEFWIGLYGDVNNWRWSLEKDGLFEEAQADLWNSGEPNHHDENFLCADIKPNNKLSDYECNYLRPFVCYTDLGSKYIYVKKPMTWTDAQKYCRTNYTDLASVRSTSENEEINQLVDAFAWIGLYRESWRWSDGQRLKMTSFSKWNPAQSVNVRNSCVTTTSSMWNIRQCSSTYPFICRGNLHRKVVKIMLKSDPSLDLEMTQDIILQQLSQRLQERGLGEVKLNWIKHPDGQTFKLKKEQ